MPARCRSIRGPASAGRRRGEKSIEQRKLLKARKHGRLWLYSDFINADWPQANTEIAGKQSVLGEREDIPRWSSSFSLPPAATRRTMLKLELQLRLRLRRLRRAVFISGYSFT